MVSLKFGPRSIDLPFTVVIRDVTEEQFEELVDEDTRAELIDGVMIVHSPASFEHDDLGGFVRALMRFYARRKKLGLVLGPDSLVRLASGRRVSPDVYFITLARVPHPRPRKQFDGLPDLAVEILSPSNRTEDVNLKWPAYRKAGVREIWLIDLAKREVTVAYHRGRGYSTRVFQTGKVESRVLSGFWIDTAWLWADPLPDEMDCLQAILG